MEDCKVNRVGAMNKATRNDWLEKTLKELPSGLRILDAGAGEQAYKIWCEHLHYISQDFAQYDGKGDAKGLQMGKWDYSKLDIVSDITAIPEPDNSFDVVLCSEVFEHLPEPLKAIEEFYRLLKKDGTLIITAPFCSLTHFAPYHYYSGYNRYFYEEHLKGNGFEIVELVPNGNFFEYLAQEIRRTPSMAKQYCNHLIDESYSKAAEVMLDSLGKLSSLDSGSDEVLCFGYHVKAVKVG